MKRCPAVANENPKSRCLFLVSDKHARHYSADGWAWQDNKPRRSALPKEKFRELVARMRARFAKLRTP